MRNKILHLFILVILLSSQEIYCQKIFRDGYVIKKTGESLIGLVEYSINQDIPSLCNFKRFDIAHPVVYSPDQISAFGYKNGNRYESKMIDNKSSFCEVIVTGKIILYSRKGKFYLDKEHSGLVELKNGPIAYQADGSKTEFKSLSEFLDFITESKSGSVSSKFSLKNDIADLITSFNKQSGNPYNVFNRAMTEKQIAREASVSGANKNRIGLVSGLNVYMLNIKPLSNIYMPDPEKETGLVFGLTYERIVSRKTDRLSLRMDLLYASQTFYCYDERKSSSGGYTLRSDAFFNFSGIKLPLMIQYSFTGGRIVPYFSSGIAYLFDIKNDYYRIEDAESIQHEVSTREFRDMIFKPGELSAVGGAGIRTRAFNNINLHLQGNIEIGPGLFRPLDGNVKEFKANSVQTTFLLGITF